MGEELAAEQQLKHKVDLRVVLVRIVNLEDELMVELHQDLALVKDVVL